ncbi:AzlC family ABC transporter permease [Pseudoteredinibacter isoporae]|uniref:AzlC family ABC transporter permease n=1 Tax=Pseudoteredinibacter isoporae TaxID=570281 RepID=UPI00310301B1
MHSKQREIWRGTLAMTPLSIAVAPWGFLVGAYALEVGLSPLEAQSLSLFVFAGTSQLVALGLMQAQAGFVAIMLTTLLITSRHLLYSMALRDKISPLPARWRYGLGFLLTDELFVHTPSNDGKPLNQWYALGAGLSFYIAWNLATLLGIVAGSAIPNLTELGLEFAVVATFTAMLVPMIRSLAIACCCATASTVAVGTAMLNWQAGLLLAILAGMVAGYLWEQASEYLQLKGPAAKSSAAEEPQ